ncbi:hypothetical protein H5410_015572, partial [Solanum commersonii]
SRGVGDKRALYVPKTSSVKWEIAQLSRDLGGFGHQELLKCLWRYKGQGQALWKDVIKCKFGESSPWCSNKSSSTYSVGLLNDGKVDRVANFLKGIEDSKGTTSDSDIFEVEIQLECDINHTYYAEKQTDTYFCTAHIQQRYGLSLTATKWTMPTQIVDLLSCWIKSGGNKSQKKWWRIILHCIKRTIWSERNSRYFEDRYNFFQKVKWNCPVLFYFWCKEKGIDESKKLVDLLGF